MRALRIVTASTLLASAAIVVPVVSVGATPHAYRGTFRTPAKAPLAPPPKVPVTPVAKVPLTRA